MYKKIVLVATAILMAACSSSDNDSSTPPSATTATGYFKDSNVIGLGYSSGSLSGMTNNNGEFEYEVGQAITFSVGAVALGTVTGDEVITPIDLATAGASDSLQVLNTVRFLLMLDSDGDPSNGINIEASVSTAAATWAQVDFSTTDLSTALSSIISDAATADGGTHLLPSAIDAQSHMESTLRCIYAGAYQGTFGGGDSGYFGLLVDVSSGFASGVAYSNGDDEFIALLGSEPVSLDQNSSFVNGNVTSGATFSGEFTSVNSLNGTWENSIFAVDGTFNGSRIGGAADALYRFTGAFEGDDIGLFSFDVDTSNQVTGVAYSYTDDEIITLTGSVSGTTLTASTSTGTTIGGTLDTATGDLSGSWSNGMDSGTYIGGGCQLN